MGMMSNICRLSLLVLIISFSLTGCREKQYFEDSGSVFHTLYSIKYDAHEPLYDKINAELQSFDMSLNPFNKESVIAKVNRNEDVEVDDWFVTVFNKAQEISAATGGAFDPTVAPLVNLWGFGFSKMDSVTPSMVDSIRELVGYKKIRLEGRKVVKDDPRIMIDFSAIAKGFASDVIAQLLEREGSDNYMVEIGGEVAMKGVNRFGECWRIGINKPSNESTAVELEEILSPCMPCGIATSGDYRNYYEKDGKRYAHTINPATGYPAAQNILSSTVLTDDCITADAYATAFMVMGSDKAVQLANSIDGLEYFFIYTDENGKYLTAHSAGLTPYMQMK
jgi:thiamine biosynthesis lipoprotein